MRGDEPSSMVLGRFNMASSPPCAGMNRSTAGKTIMDERVPRMRGDEPGSPKIASISLTSSPHARG